MAQTILIPRTANSGTTPIQSPFVKLRASKGAGGEACGNISVQLVTDGTLDGPWTILASNKPDCDVNGDADAVDVTAAFVTGASGGGGVVTVVHGTVATQRQGVQAGPFWFAAIAVKLAPSAGNGTGSAFLNEAVG